MVRTSFLAHSFARSAMNEILWGYTDVDGSLWTEVVDRRRKLWTVDGSCGRKLWTKVVAEVVDRPRRLNKSFLLDRVRPYGAQNEK